MKIAGVPTVIFGADPNNLPPAGQKIFCLCGMVIETTENEIMCPVKTVANIDGVEVFTPIGWYAPRGCPACGGSVFVPKINK